jgi:hypothetical protein
MMGKLLRYAFINIAFVRCQANVSHSLGEHDVAFAWEFGDGPCRQFAK